MFPNQSNVDEPTFKLSKSIECCGIERKFDKRQGIERRSTLNAPRHVTSVIIFNFKYFYLLILAPFSSSSSSESIKLSESEMSELSSSSTSSSTQMLQLSFESDSVGVYGTNSDIIAGNGSVLRV